MAAATVVVDPSNAAPPKRRQAADLVMHTTDLTMRQLEDVSAEPPDYSLHPGKSRQGGGSAGTPLGKAKRSKRAAKSSSTGLTGPAPRHNDLSAGWRTLLDEVSASARRVRSAKGGHIGGQTVGQAAHEASLPSSPSGAVRQTRSQAEVTLRNAARSPALGNSLGRDQPIGEAADVWQSYRIDDGKVPDRDLGVFWSLAVDPKRCHGTVQQLDPVHRLTVNRRDIPLPAVHGIEHWRQCNTKRRETNAAKKEAKQCPSLQDMLNTIFGEEPPASKRLLELQDSERFAGKTQKLVDWIIAGEELVDEPEIRAEIEQCLQEELHEEHRVWDEGHRFVGVREKGRRHAFDAGLTDQYSARGGKEASAFDALRDKGDLRRCEVNAVSHAKLRRALKAARAARPDGDDNCDAILERLKAVSIHVQSRAQWKLHRMQQKFLRKQGELSSRLHGRIRRVQLDFQEIHDMKASSILPDNVVAPCEAGDERHLGVHSKNAGPPDALGAAGAHVAGPAAPATKGGVIEYLNGHRKVVEATRQTQHSVYTKQVERFQHHVRLLADPNRVPERGEVYLSECFRHVLAAGLIVDTSYFLRVLENLEGEDLEKTPTVNLLAACCEAFDVDLSRYWAHLRKAKLPCFMPRGCPEQVKAWEDGAPWNGVTLDPVPTPGDLHQQEDLPTLLQDPLPFGPIVPDEPPTASELASRDDPLADALEELVLDSVLGRYGLRAKGDLPGGACGRRSKRVGAAAIVAAAAEQRRADELSAVELQPSAPPPMSARGPKRNPINPKAFATLQSTRGLASMPQTPRSLARPKSRPNSLPPVAEGLGRATASPISAR